MFEFNRHRKSGGQPMVFERQAYDLICDTVGSLLPETGGILLGSRDDFTVRKFVHDPTGRRTAGGYDPDITFINRVVKEEWERNQLALLGFIHSHPRGIERLSGDWGNGIGDLGYLRRIFDSMPKLNKFLVPIVFSTSDGGERQIFAHVAHRGAIEDYETTTIEVLEGKRPPRRRRRPEGADLSRLEGAVDLGLMQRAHVVAVGAGGAAGLYEDLARSGLGRLTVVDFDTVDRSNLGTQGYDLADIGHSKVEALGRRLQQVAPELHYEGLKQDFLLWSEQEITTRLGEADLLLFMTDNFGAQARGNRVALKLGKPAVFAIVYERAWCAEITFVIPGVTPACHRCAVSSRYAAHAAGPVAEVRQQRSTVFHTHYLNACLGLVSLAILHRNTRDLEFSGWFGSRWERNLVQLRMHPRWGERKGSLVDRTYNGSPRVFDFDSIWQLIEPERPPKYEPCPDCGGGGDLLHIPAIHDTHVKL
jgi:ThiF family